jgi:outer membrane protein OmpA-like peptidoglycan-associated protein
MKVDPSLEYKTSRQTEKIVFLESAMGQTVRDVTRNEDISGGSDYSPSAPNASNATNGRDSQEIPGSPLEAGAKGKPVILKNVFFGFDSNLLSEVAKRELQLVYESQKEAKALTIIGHTDSKGSASYNQGLSERRAAAAGAYIKSLGFKGDLITIGKGESSPIATNETETGRAKNRRVEIVIYY